MELALTKIDLVGAERRNLGKAVRRVNYAYEMTVVSGELSSPEVNLNVFFLPVGGIARVQLWVDGDREDEPYVRHVEMLRPSGMKDVPGEINLLEHLFIRACQQPLITTVGVVQVGGCMLTIQRTVDMKSGGHVYDKVWFDLRATFENNPLPFTMKILVVSGQESDSGEISFTIGEQGGWRIEQPCN